MVSLFGLKLGGEKKKKNPEQPTVKSVQPRKKVDQNEMGEGEFFGKECIRGKSYAASIRSTKSHYSIYKVEEPSRRKYSVYASDTHNLAAVSMNDLAMPVHTKQSMQDLKSAMSNPSLARRFPNGSEKSFSSPSPRGSRPGTAAGSAGKQKAWVNPLDVHFNKSSATSLTTMFPTPPSFNTSQTVASASAVVAGGKEASNPSRLSRSLTRISHARAPPSPTDSIGEADHRPGSSGHALAHWPKDISCTKMPDELGIRDGPETTRGYCGPPSPPSSIVQDGEVKHQASTNNAPVIQNVRARRETMTINAVRRRSFERKVEAFNQASLAGSSPIQERNSPGQQKSHVTTPVENSSGYKGIRNFSLGSHQKVAPAAAVGAGERTTRFNTVSARRPAVTEYTIITRTARAYSDASVYSTHSETEFPEVQESLVLPVSSPLASPRDTNDKELNWEFRFPDWSALAEDGSTTETTLTLADPAPETSFWPSESPSSAASKMKSADSPRLPAARAGSPFAIPSFSRPWTTSNRPSSPVKITEITITNPPRDNSTGVRSPSIQSPPRGPPPRSPIVYQVRGASPQTGHQFTTFL